MEKYVDKNGILAPRVILLDGKQIINPTDEMLRKAGYTPYVEPLPTDEELLLQAIDAKVMEIEAYDSSEAVNSFLLDGMPLWLDRETRMSVMHSTQIEIAQKRTETTLWFGGHKLVINCDIAIKLLHQLELYALECFDRTEEHKSAVRKLKSVEEVKKYDYRTGYPEKLNLKTK